MATAAGASGGAFWAAVLGPSAFGAAATAGAQSQPPRGATETPLGVQLLQYMAVNVLQAELECRTAAPSLPLLAAAASLLSHPALWRRSPPAPQHQHQHSQDNSGPGGEDDHLSAGRRTALDAVLSYYVQVEGGFGSTEATAAAFVLLPVLAAAMLPAPLPYGSKAAGGERVPYSPYWEQALPVVLLVAAASQLLTPPAAATATATAVAPIAARAATRGHGVQGAGIGVVGPTAAAVAASAAAALCGGGAGGALGGAGAECAGWGLIAASGWVVLRVLALEATREQLQPAMEPVGLRESLQQHQEHHDRLRQTASLLVAQAAAPFSSTMSSSTTTKAAGLGLLGADSPDEDLQLSSLLDSPWWGC